MLDRFHKISEIVAAFAIVGSLLFVGIQMRQNTDAMRVSFVQSSIDSWNIHAMTMASNEHLMTSFNEGSYPEVRKKFGTPSPSDSQVGMWIAAGFRTTETMYLQWREGNLPDDIWQGYRSSMVRAFAGNRTYYEKWGLDRTLFTPGFRAYGDALRVQGDELRTLWLSSD
jgi:hypothetical protein